MQTNRADTQATPQLGRYEIDPGRSTVTFRTRHLFGLDRTGFGLVAARGLAGRYLDIAMEVQCVRK